MTSLYVFPPKIIWIRTGNIPTETLANILKTHSNISNTWITKVSFEITYKEREIIEKEQFETVEYESKNQKIQFKILG